jgi:PAS domain S-box-containing protein
MPTLKQTLSYLILGQKGGKNRIQIIDLLNDRPYNLHQLAEILNVNYRTVQHHIDVLKKNELVSSSKTGGHGEVYFLTPEMESNMALFNNLVKRLSDITSTPGFFQNILEQSNLSVIIIDNSGEVLFWNIASEELYGFTEEEVVGTPIPIFADDDVRNDFINKAESGDQISSVECQLRDKSGAFIDISLTIDSIKDENNELIGFSILTKDISQQKREEEKLRESEKKYRTVLEGCCPETIEEIKNEKQEETPEGLQEGAQEYPSCPVNYGPKDDKKKSASGCDCVK